MFLIKTPRLSLIPLKAPLLEVLKKSRRQMEEQLGLQPSGLQIHPAMEEEIEEAMAFWLEFTTNNPDDYQWGTNWEIVLNKENRTIGGIGLGGPPNQKGQVTVGYHIDPREHAQGYATEALAGMRDWAMQQPTCTSMVAFTPIENLPSQKVLAKCNFELMDEVEESGMACYIWCYKAVATS